MTEYTHDESVVPAVMEICKRCQPLPMAIGQRTGVCRVAKKKTRKPPPNNAATAGLKPPDLGTGGGRDPHPCRVDGYCNSKRNMKVVVDKINLSSYTSDEHIVKQKKLQTKI